MTAAGRGRGRDLGRPGFALYLTGGTLAALIFLLPLAWAVLRSIMPSALVTQAPSAGDFSHLTTANYSGLIQANDILRYAANSLGVAVGTGLLTAVIATMAGSGSPASDSAARAWCSRSCWSR
jgi:multiple sugar transport system permease protein